MQTFSDPLEKTAPVHTVVCAGGKKGQIRIGGETPWQNEVLPGNEEIPGPAAGDQAEYSYCVHVAAIYFFYNAAV